MRNEQRVQQAIERIRATVTDPARLHSGSTRFELWATDIFDLLDLAEEVDNLRRQLAEAQDSAANGWARAAASPALIEEYARACHYAGSSGLAMVDWPQWLSQRATRE